MARNVADVAVALGVMTGVDPADAATKRSEGRFETRLHQVPESRRAQGRAHRHRPRLHGPGRRGGLGDRGVARRPCAAAGATVVDVRFPKWLLDAKGEFYTAVRYPEFPVQIGVVSGHPEARVSEDAGRDDRAVGPHRVDARRRRRSEPAALEPVQARGRRAAPIDGYRYTPCAITGLPLVRATVEGVLSSSNARRRWSIPTSSRRPELISGAARRRPAATAASGSNLANLSGFPGSDRAGRLHERPAAVSASRSSGRPSAKASCSASATRSSRRPRPAGARRTRRRCRASRSS